MSKSTFRHAGSRTPRGVISHFGAHRAGESQKHTPRHAAERSTREGCFPGGDVVRLAAGLAAIAVTAIGATTVGASIDDKYVDDKYDKADTSIQQPEKRKPDESTGTPPQPTGLDSIIDQSPEERRIVIDGASRVSACDIRSQQGELGEDVKCVHPNIFAYLGANPAEGFSSNMLPVSVDNRKQSTSA